MSTSLDHFQQLITLNHEMISKESVEHLHKAAEQLVEWVLAVDPEDLKLVDQVSQALFELGSKEQVAYWQLNNRLIQPLQQLMADTDAGGKVSKLLGALSQQVANMQPPKRKLSWKERFMLLFSWRESAHQMWLDTYPEKRAVMLGLVEQLNAEKRQLKRDNHLLTDDLEALMAGLTQLTQSFDFVSVFAQTLKQKAMISGNLSAAQTAVIEDELMGPTQQRIIELQQQLLIARQAVMTVELIIKQNHTLIRDIDQTVLTTTAALDVAAGVAMANNSRINHQRNKHINLDMHKLLQAKALIDQSLEQIKQVSLESSSLLADLIDHEK